ncbi:hypothetical protein SEA_MAGICMAN_37 [Gordonia phage MagicMan]|uniref:Uncharacterized protein n=1 Tax=Gordonia phage Schnabeltier TaxID=1821561 RepID=A0A142KA25_9CAUD|nr:hypothetical protein BJD60_gp37 [Gordonia phage Schnabeltier]AMS02958.1 hypothetical protein SEA_SCHNABELTIER_37 [Gordonia phage Schnabeltier]QDM55854.1 hypothetical protein SEA_MAGICMAN_37 [Gordonia phage MagicMan]
MSGQLPSRRMRNLVAAALLAILTLAATACGGGGESADPPSSVATATNSSAVAAPSSSESTATAAAAGPPALEPVVAQFVSDSNASIGEDYRELLGQYATPDCAATMLALGNTNTSSPTRIVSVSQDGATGTSVTALRDDPTSPGATLQWAYSDRWRFTCEGIFQ